jgi:hypothetical protein
VAKKRIVAFRGHNAVLFDSVSKRDLDEKGAGGRAGFEARALCAGIV